MQEQIQYINVEDIIPNRFQPRKNFDQDALQELAESIQQHGMIQPLVLRKLGDKYEIIAGERRYKASNMLGLKQVPSIVMELDDATSAEVALAENIQRKDLTAVEKAKSYKQILSLGQMTQEQLAKKMGKSQPAVSNTLRLLELSDEVQQALLKNKISERHARSLLSIKDHDRQIEMLNHIIDNRMTVRETDLAIKEMLEKDKEINQNQEPQETQVEQPKQEEIEEIIDFDTDNNQNNENTIKEEVIQEDIKQPENNDIPEFDQININQNNKFINNYSNLDDEAANMDIGVDAENDKDFDNFISTPTNEPNLNIEKEEEEEKEVSKTPMLSEENNAFNQPMPENITQNEVYQPTQNYDQNQQMMQDPNMMYNQQPQMYGQNNMYYPNQQMMQDPNMMYNQQPQMYGQNNMYYPNQQMMQDPNMMYNQQPQMYGQNNMYYPNQQPFQDPNMMYNQQPQMAPMTPDYNNMYNQPQPDTFDSNQNALLPEQNNTYQPNEEINPEPIQESGPQAMIMQHDITGAVAVIRNTIMNLQNNGYMLEMTEDDETNKYVINITIDK